MYKKQNEIDWKKANGVIDVRIVYGSGKRESREQVRSSFIRYKPTSNLRTCHVSRGAPNDIEVANLENLQVQFSFEPFQTRFFLTAIGPKFLLHIKGVANLEVNKLRTAKIERFCLRLEIHVWNLDF